MTITIEKLDYPELKSIPEYAVEAAKLARFYESLKAAESEDVRLVREWVSTQTNLTSPTDAERIRSAEALLSGERHIDYPEKIGRNRVLIASLERAAKAQRAVVDKIADDASAKAAQRFEAEHKARTRRVMVALSELADANAAEVGLRLSVESLGYSQKLPCTRFAPPGHTLDPRDVDGGCAFSWARDMAAYTVTEEQREATAQDGRRRKLAGLTA